MTLLEGEADGVTNLDCLPNDASWLCSLDCGSHSVLCWVASSLFRQQQGRSGLSGELEVKTLVAMELWKYAELATRRWDLS